MRVISYTRPDGGTSIVRPAAGARLATSVSLADGTRLTSDGPQPVNRFAHRWPIEGATAEWAETENEFIGRVRARSIPPDAPNITIVDESAIPLDRTFRDAWKPDLTCDLAKARGIQRDRMRATRKPLLAALDAEYMRADEADDTVKKAEIAAKKQALRDVTADPRIEAATTPEGLKAVWPAVLTEAPVVISVLARSR
jgi:hypothetical protein